MITEAFHHCPGVGPVRLNQLHAAGVRTWHDVIACPEKIPGGIRTAVLAESQASLKALEQNDISYLANRLAPQDRWRILWKYFEETTFFDIETTGLEYDSTTTLIVCWHRGQLHTFVEHENLDDFLELLEDVRLLASFNGSSFDVPRVLSTFHIPQLTCPHIDLRWTCFHQNLSGGLKDIARRMDIRRPDDLDDADGSLAVKLWERWRNLRDNAARERLIRYCAADVVLSVLVAQHVAQRNLYIADELWKLLPAAAEQTDTASSRHHRTTFLSHMFGTASPAKLRMRRRI